MERKEILEQLAAKQITREEAERQLAELGDPLPAPAQTPPKVQRSGGMGCLIAAVVLFLLLILGAIGTFIAYRFFAHDSPLDAGPSAPLQQFQPARR